MMSFKLIFVRECWNLWNYVKIRVFFLFIVLLLLISVLFINSDDKNLLDIIYGMLQVHGNGSNPLFENINWLTIQILPLMLVGSYVYEDLFLSGPFILLRIKNRKLLWISKISILFLITIFYYLFIFILIQLMGFFFHFSTWSESHFLYTKIPSIIIAFLLGTFTLLLLQSVMSMLLTPIFGFILSIVLCVINIYFQLLFIPGNISDVLAYSVFNGNHSFTLGIISQLLWITVLSLFGGYYYKNADLLYRI